MTDPTGNPPAGVPANDSTGSRPPQRPVFPTQGAPAESIVPPPAVEPSAPPIAPPAAPAVPPAAAAPVSPPPAAAPVAPPTSAPLPPVPTYDEKIAQASQDAQSTDRNPGRNPGKTLGIIGLVLAIPVALLGLIFSILGLRKSKKAGQGNGLAWTGIVVSTLVILGVVAGSIFTIVVLQPAFTLAQACAEAGPGQYTDQNGNPVTCE